MADYVLTDVHNGPQPFQRENRYAKARLNDGRVFLLGVERGSPVRAMYGKRGFKWIGFVRNDRGNTIFTAQVDKSCGFRRLLLCANLIACDHRRMTPGFSNPVFPERSLPPQCKDCGMRKLPDGSWGPFSPYANHYTPPRKD